MEPDKPNMAKAYFVGKAIDDAASLKELKSGGPLVAASAW
jgi:hypothetical protein